LGESINYESFAAIMKISCNHAINKKSNCSSLRVFKKKRIITKYNVITMT